MKEDLEGFQDDECIFNLFHVWILSGAAAPIHAFTIKADRGYYIGLKSCAKPLPKTAKNLYYMAGFGIYNDHINLYDDSSGCYAMYI